MADHSNPPPQDDSTIDPSSATVAGNGVDQRPNVNPTNDNTRKRPRPSNDAEDDDEEDAKGGSRERRKIEIKFIQDKSRRHITFSKRKAGIMKKAYELSVLTGTQVLLLVVSETGLVYTFTTPKLQPLVTKAEGKNLIQACLNAPEPHTENGGGDDGSTIDSPEEQHAQLPQQPVANRNVGMPVGPGVGTPNPYMNIPEAQQSAQVQAMQQAAYQQYVQQQQQQQQQQQHQQQAHVQRGYNMPQHPGHPSQNP